MKSRRQVILFIAMSLDGYIAGRDDDINFLSFVEKPGEDYGYSDFIKEVDTVIMGRRTYDKVLSFNISYPHADKKTFVITRQPRASYNNIEFYTGDLKDLIGSLKKAEGKNIFIDGGAEITNNLMRQNLIDDINLSIIPVLLGDGIPLFKSGLPRTNLNLIEVKTFDKGLVQLHYQKY